MTEKARLRVRVYLGSVYAAGAIALGGVLATAQWRVSTHLMVLVALVALLMVSSEFMPIRVWSRGGFREYTFSGAFALVLLQIAPLEWAVLPQAIAILVEEIRQRKPVKVAVFNVAQNVLMLVLARLALDAVEGSGTGVPDPASAGRQLLGLLAAALVYFIVNLLLTTTVVALSSGTSVTASIAAGMRREIPVTPIVLGVAPLFVASLQFSVWTVPLCLVLMITIRTAARISTEHEVAALHDVLTGLPNRTLMLTRLNQSLETVDGQRQTALLMIDLDHFKEINDSLGHSTGDELLMLVAERLKEAAGPDGTVARLGGDEFAILLEPVDDGTQAREIAERISTAIAVPFAIAGKEVLTRASIGIALSDEATASGDDLVQDADVAMYRAKKSRPGSSLLFESGMRSELLRHVELTADATRAFEAGDFRLVYQPIVALPAGRPVAVEALLRWTHPRLGMIPPATFVPLAEQSGLIVALGRWVLREACRELAGWRAAGLPDLTVSVNVSGRQLADERLLPDVFAVLSETGLPPTALTLEVTETALMRDPVQALRRLRALKQTGVRLAVDDFGSGASSMAHLGRLPIDQLKIDKSFLDGLAGDRRRSAILRSVLELGGTLELETVAKGVEEPAQLAALAALPCTLAQGFLFAEPMPAARVPEFAARHGLLGLAR